MVVLLLPEFEGFIVFGMQNVVKPLLVLELALGPGYNKNHLEGDAYNVIASIA